MTDHGYIKEILALSIGPLYLYLQSRNFQFQKLNQKAIMLIAIPCPYLCGLHYSPLTFYVTEVSLI